MPEARGSLGLGLLIGLGATVVGLLLSFVLAVSGGGAGVILLLGIGIGQALWILPAFLYFKGRGEMETGKGILIIAGIVFLLNATCWGVLMSAKIIR